MDKETHLDADAPLFQIRLAFVLAGIQLHLDPEGNWTGTRSASQWTYSCLRFPRSSFIFTSSLSTSLRRAAMVARMAAVSFRPRELCSVLISESAARKRYACCEGWVTNKGSENSTHVVKVLHGEAIALDSSNAVDEERASCAHETAGRRGREGALEGGEERMGVKRGRGIGRRCQRAGRDRRARLVVLQTDKDPCQACGPIHTSCPNSDPNLLQSQGAPMISQSTRNIPFYLVQTR